MDLEKLSEEKLLQQIQALLVDWANRKYQRIVLSTSGKGKAALLEAIRQLILEKANEEYEEALRNALSEETTESDSGEKQEGSQEETPPADPETLN